jgi:ATP-dependent HslUV protease ATP-binding subunit HslU
VLTTLLEDILFDLPELGAKQIEIDAETVRNRLKDIVEDEDLRKYIL